jgi:phosphonate transport system substrate-binding protein
MKNIFTGRLTAAAVVSAFILAGCSIRKEATVGTPENPLVVVFSPEHVPVGTREPLLFIKNYLSARTGLTVETKTAGSSMEAIDLLGSDKADVAFMTTEEYLVAREEFGVQAALQVTRRGGDTKYDGVILVKAAGGPRTAAALAGKKFAFADPYSISGYFLPSVFLKKEGVKVQPVFAGSHKAAVAALLKGKADAAATYSAAAVAHPELRVLAVTGTVPNGPVVVRRALLPDKRKAVTDALAALPGTPEGKRALGAVADISGFAPASDDAYRDMHGAILGAGRSVYDLLPEGWHIRQLNEPYMP